MWSYLTMRSFLNPLASLVESKIWHCRNALRLNLLEFIRSNRSMFVLKPNDDHGGHGIHFGAQLDERDWDNAIKKSL